MIISIISEISHSNTLQIFNKTDVLTSSFLPSDFDLIIVDEAHRTIGGKAREVFEYFVGYKIGLTATPKDYFRGVNTKQLISTNLYEYDARAFRDTYLTFGCSSGKPTYEFTLADGVKKGILVMPYKAHDKREATGVKSVSKYGKDRAHLLTGIIKCPKCGSGMYANRVCWTKKDGTYKEVMYYACSRNKQERGHYCDYSANLKKTDIEPLVIEFIKDLVQDEHFAIEIKKKIGLQVDTTAE